MKITLYTINDCKFSQEERDYLKTNNLPFEEKNLEVNREFLTEMLSVSNNFAGTPVTKIEKDNGETVVLKGFTKEEFDAVFGGAPQPVVAVTPSPVGEMVPPTQPVVESPVTNVVASPAPSVSQPVEPVQPVQPAPVVVESLSSDVSPQVSVPMPQAPAMPPMPSAPMTPTPVETTMTPPPQQPMTPPVMPQTPVGAMPAQDPLNSVLQNLQSQVQAAPTEQPKQ